MFICNLPTSINTDDDLKYLLYFNHIYLGHDRNIGFVTMNSFLAILVNSKKLH